MIFDKPGVAMLFVIDLDLLQVIKAATDKSPVVSVEGKRGDDTPFEVIFVRSGVAGELAGSTVLTFGAKQAGKYDGTAVVLNSDFTLSGSGTTAKYLASPSFNTEELNALFLIDDDDSNDPAYVDLMAEFTWQIGAGAPSSTKTFAFRVHNDIVRDSELSPSAVPTPIGTTAPINGWTPRDSVRSWVGAASSDDGSKLVAVHNGGQIYTSTDTGATWTARDSTRNWSCVASSSDGAKLVAAEGGGQIYTSTNSGATWTARDSSRAWRAVASSANGVKLVAVVESDQIYTSTDSGITWTDRESSRNWVSVASSSDGVKLVAAVSSGQIYTSTDSGVTWIARDSSRGWICVASSSDGVKLVAVVEGGQIYTSTNSGATWTARDSSRAWRAVASSSDGVKLVAAADVGQIYTSTDSGITWTAGDADRYWRAVASSSDGVKLVAAADVGQIYTSTTSGLGTLSPPYIRVAGDLLYIQQAGLWMETNLHALGTAP